MKSDIISIAMGELTVAFDNEVMKAVQKVGIDVDKEELLKALELYHNLVRCGECKYASDNKVYGCMLNHFNDNGYDYHRMYADDFCSRGEREGADDE